MPRRHDPERRDRIIDVTIDLIAEHGVTGTTHRLVAAAADVPLGSVTYHFSGLADLRQQAFSRHALRMAEGYAARFEKVCTRKDLVEAVTGLVNDPGQQRDWIVAYELYLAALRDEGLRSVTEAWMRSSRAVLERFMDAASARYLDGLIEGLAMHRELSTHRATRSQTRLHVTRALEGARLKVPDS